MRKIFLIILFISIPVIAQTAVSIESEKEAVINCAYDYGLGWYTGDAARMERAIHPELNKILVTKLKADGKSVLQYSTVSGLVEMTRSKGGLLEESKRNASAVVYDIDGNFACAKLNSAQFNDYLTLVKVDGTWKILNVLWNPGPASPQKPVVKDFNPDAEKELIKKASSDFAAGILGGDAAKYNNSVHPEINIVQAAIIPTTGKLLISKLGPSFVNEMISTGRMNVPENQRGADVKILDSFDGYAFVKCSSPALVFFIQMAKIEGDWKIINVLLSRTAPPKK